MAAMHKRAILGLCIGFGILAAVTAFLPPTAALFVFLSFIAAGPCFYARTAAPAGPSRHSATGLGRVLVIIRSAPPPDGNRGATAAGNPRPCP